MRFPAVSPSLPLSPLPLGTSEGRFHLRTTSRGRFITAMEKGTMGSVAGPLAQPPLDQFEFEKKLGIHGARLFLFDHRIRLNLIIYIKSCDPCAGLLRGRRGTAAPLEEKQLAKAPPLTALLQAGQTFLTQNFEDTDGCMVPRDLPPWARFRFICKV